MIFRMNFIERTAVAEDVSVIPVAALKRIVIEEKRRFEREKLLALASAKKGAAK